MGRQPMNMNRHFLSQRDMLANRRTFLSRTGLGVGSAALAALLGRDLSAAEQPGIAPGVSALPHFAPQVKRVIFLCMAGGPSHLETFDYKPEL